jgi:hypothetical protein
VLPYFGLTGALRTILPRRAASRGDKVFGFLLWSVSFETLGGFKGLLLAAMALDAVSASAATNAALITIVV